MQPYLEIRPARVALGIASAVYLIPLVGAMVFTARFASGWEGGGRSLGHTIVSVIPLLYIVYCFVCSLLCLTGKALYISGALVHFALLAYFIILYRNAPVASGGLFFWIELLGFLALVWVVYCAYVVRAQLRA